MGNFLPDHQKFILKDYPPLPHLDDMAPDAARLIREHEHEVNQLIGYVVQGECQRIGPALAQLSAKAHPVNWLSMRFAPEYMMVAGGFTSPLFALLGTGLNFFSIVSVILGFCGITLLHLAVRRFRKYGVVDAGLVKENKLILSMGHTFAHTHVHLTGTGTEDVEATHEVRSELAVGMAEVIESVHGHAVLLRAAQAHYGMTPPIPASGR